MCNDYLQVLYYNSLQDLCNPQCLMPGCSTPVSATNELKAAPVTGAGSTKREPTVVGKPEEFMLANIAAKSGLRRDQICMVGDRLDTDIQFGNDGGLTTLLVLSGELLSSGLAVDF